MLAAAIATAWAGSALSAPANIGGNAVIGTTHYPNGGTRRVGKLTLTTDTAKGLYNGVYDGARYAYFGPTNGWVVKVDLSGPLPIEVEAIDCTSGGAATVIDPAAGYLWHGNRKVKLDDGTGHMQCLGTMPVSPFGMVIDLTDPDPANHFILAAVSNGGGNPASIYKVAPGAGDNAPSVLGSITLGGANAEPLLRRAVLDVRDPSLANHAALFATAAGGASAVFIKVALGAGNNPVLIGATTTNAGDGHNIGAAGFDPIHGNAYFATYGSPGANSDRVIEVAMGSAGQVPVRLRHLQLGNGEILLSTGVIDPESGFAWFSNDLCYPASIFKIDLSDFIEAPPLALQGGTVSPTPPNGMNDLNRPETKYGEVFMQSSVIDPANGYAYFGTDSVKGQVVKVALSQKSAVKASRAVVAADSAVRQVDFYAHAADGHVRLALYDDTVARNLLWQSPSIPVVSGWMSVPIAAGAPGELLIPAGNYWLAWQVDSNKNVPSYLPGAAGDGWLIERSFGAFPATANAATSTAETWSIYLDAVTDAVFADGFEP